MKKISLIIIITIFSLLYYKCNAEAKLLTREEISYLNAEPLISEEITFNIIMGTKIKDRYEKSPVVDSSKCWFENYVDYLDLEVNYEIYGDGGSDVLNFSYIIDEGKPFELSYMIAEEVFYKLNLSNDSFNVLINKEVNLNEIIGFSINDYKFKYLDYSINEIVYKDDISEVVIDEFIYESKLSLLYGYTYKYNSIYNDQKIYFVTTNSNPLTLQEIKSNITITDQTDCHPTFEIINNEYKLETIEITDGGEFSFVIQAMDYAGNITLQDCMVYVYDDIPPNITGSNFSIAYNLFFTEADLRKQFICDDQNASITIIKPDNLLYNSRNYPGIYTVTAEAVDIAGNKSIASIEVEIYDRDKPTISSKGKEHVLLSTKLYSKEEILDFLNINDFCYGNNLIIEIVDYDDYAQYYYDVGPNRLLITATDPSGNKESYVFEFSIVDIDFPQIDVGNKYTLFIDNDSVLTKEEIIELLISSGQLSDDIVKIESDYFDSINPTGTYDLLVYDKDGNIITCSIEIKSPNISFEAPPNKAEEDNNYLIYVIISGGIIVFVGVILFLVYKKKKH